MKIITFLTDFGVHDSYVAQMKGVAAGITSTQLIDITHAITPHNIREGAFILQSAVPYFPVGTIHVAVVDPGVGTDRKGLIITTPNHVLVGPDNGLLLPAAHLLDTFTVYEITNTQFMMSSPSNTFHGRDIFTPIAAHIARGVPFQELGTQTDTFIDLSFGQAVYNEKSVTGKVIYCDGFGNIITNIAGMQLLKTLKFKKKVMAFIGENPYEIPFVPAYGFVKKGTIVGTIGSSHFFEIGINQGNAAKKLKIKEDETIKLLFS